MNKTKIFVLAAFLFCCLTQLIAQDWPQYLGPTRNSISPEKNIMRSWPEGGPEVLWTAPVGIGYGGPVVKDGKVYLLDHDDKVGDNLRCLDLATGKELWNFAWEAPGAVMFPGSRSVPAVDGNRVYSCGPYGDLYCIDTNTHKPLWKKNVWKDYGGEEIPIWAIAQCPLVYGNMLIIASMAPKAGVVAYNKLTGEVIWQTPNLGNETYVSPSVAKIDGQDHIVMVTSSTNTFGHPNAEPTPGTVVGIDPKDGKILWKYKGWKCHISVPGPVDAGNNKLLITGGYELGATMIQVEKKADGTYGAKELFTTVEFGDQTKTPLLYNGYFYAQYGTNNRRDGLVCMNMDGQVMWKTKRDPDFNKGSMILADGMILATNGAKALYLIEPDPSGFKALATADLLKEEANGEGIAARIGGASQNWAPIALADGKLLIRDQKRMMCVKVAK
ncbi:MAG TPA: PQQ-binding-like beta-propeller repeat protein [Prolixibacteraceae bacterium]|nr:PQQ-binding-like beta-propeller repeat protein [Prolixibacteraceae bacterium]